MSLEKTIWFVSREYAGIAEAGGVKNVAASLAEGLYQEGCTVCVFMPLYGCTVLNGITDFIISPCSARIKSGGKEYTVYFATGSFHGISFVFTVHSLFTEKMGIYTYTEDEERLNQGHVQGRGHEDSLLLNVLFQKSVLEYGRLQSLSPDIIHCQDAPSALVPFFARTEAAYVDTYAKTAFVVTIHNAGNAYRHEIPYEQAASLLGTNAPLPQDAVIENRVEPYLLAEKYATFTTVSPWYADELRDPANKNAGALACAFAERKTPIAGITNGIEYAKYDPRNTAVSTLPYAFDPASGDLCGKYECRKDFLSRYCFNRFGYPCPQSGLYQYGFIDHAENAVFFSYHGRIVHQKGTDILAAAAKIILEQNDDVRFIVTGQGNGELEKKQAALAAHFPGKYLYLRGYSRPSARLCVAVSDFIVLPSIFEPCGLEDFIAQIYGTIPVAHACGGLQKISDRKTGFLYKNNTADTLAKVLLELTAEKQNNPDFFKDIAVRAACNVQTEYSWKKIIQNQYIPLYAKAAAESRSNF